MGKWRDKYPVNSRRRTAFVDSVGLKKRKIRRILRLPVYPYPPLLWPVIGSTRNKTRAAKTLKGIKGLFAGIEKLSHYACNWNRVTGLPDFGWTRS